MNKLLKGLFFLMVVLFGCASKESALQTTTQYNGKTAYEHYISSREAIEENEHYRIYEQLFEKENQKIYGQLVLPKQYNKQLPVVIIGHGFNSSHALNMVYAKALANSGIAAYAFDFIGGSSVSKSDGEMIDTSIISQRRDMEMVLQQLRAYEFLDNNNVFLMGDSQGGLVAALTAGLHPNLVKGLVLLYPALRLPNMLKLFEKNLDKLPDKLTIMGATIGKRYVTDVAGLDVNSEIAKFKGNVLIVQGDKDLIVPLSSSQEAVEVYDNANLEVIKGAGHGFDNEQTGQVIKKIVNYIVTNLNQ